MKREINCSVCARSWRKSFAEIADTFEVRASGENITQRAGTLKLPAVCDGCGAAMPIGTPAIATSVYNDSAPYFAWENDFLSDLEQLEKK